MIENPRREVSILSPLRYPGAKRRLAHYIAQTIELNELRPDLFVEPFAGGASVGLQLLNDGVVRAAGFVERDPLVASFWQTAFFDSDWLIDAVSNVEVTLERWNLFKTATPGNSRDRALACLFLNRTSFSGILHPTAGPIGGQRQASVYDIACRFNKDTIIRRLRQVAMLADRVAFIVEGDWTAALCHPLFEACPMSRRLTYLDPPFFAKAEKLYTYAFEQGDHVALRDALLGREDAWILSYDAHPRVEELYRAAGISRSTLAHLYSASRGRGQRPAEELIITNSLDLPADTRLWRSALEWTGSGHEDAGAVQDIPHRSKEVERDEQLAISR